VLEGKMDVTIKKDDVKYDAELAALEKTGEVQESKKPTAQTKTKVVKDLKYNSQYNTELNNGEIEGVPSFYIAGKPGYSFNINVGAKGSVFIKVFDRNLGQSYNIIMSAEEVLSIKNFK
jgi:hypothetical protein